VRGGFTGFAGLAGLSFIVALRLEDAFGLDSIGRTLEFDADISAFEKLRPWSLATTSL